MKNGWIDNLKLVPLKRKIYLLLMVMMCAMGSGWAQAQETGFQYFSPFRAGSDFIMLEKVCLIAVLAVAVALYFPLFWSNTFSTVRPFAPKTSTRMEQSRRTPRSSTTSSFVPFGTPSWLKSKLIF